MSEDNKKRTKKTNNKKEKKKKKKKSGFKMFLISLLIIFVIAIGALTGIVIAIAKEAPKIDPANISSLLNQTSFILDEKGEIIEKIQTEEYRTIVDLEKIPVHLQKAFISIEDERFDKHAGVDPRGIMSAIVDNFKAKATIRGASTITQQLSRNLYLTNEKKLDRKIKEAYLALQLEKALTKDQILEAYLNRIYLGQGAYGVQEASQTYFTKDVEDLTIAESAILAGIVKSPSNYPPYKTIKPEDFDKKIHVEVGHMDILGEKYIAVYNEEAIKRQGIVLMKMKELGYINEKEYKQAVNEDIKGNLKPGEKKIKGISSYFTDFVKSQVIDSLVEDLGYTKEDAEKELYTGGLKIHSTMDINMQHKIEEVYKNFTEVLFGNPTGSGNPILISWSLDGNQNIIDERNNIIYYNKENLFDENFKLLIEKDTFQVENDNLIINNKKFTPYKKNIDIANYYTINDKSNLVTHNLGSLAIPDEAYSIGENKEIIISKAFLNENDDFYSIDNNGNLIISDSYFFRSKDGVVQPQSATVIMDHTNGQIKSLVGGRDIEGNKLLNRATSSPRQPGSSIKPISVYLPALDNGFTAATPIDDIPHYNGGGTLWPTNWYKSYWGLTTLRKSVEQSVNVNSVKTLESIGIDTSIEYLSRMGIVDKNDPKNDNLITSKENEANNDENLAALGLGGMTKGLTPLEMTAAYSSIANGGTYVEPVAFTKVLDKDGNVLLDNKPKKNKVVSPDVAYIMTDILRTTVTSGTAKRAAIPNMATAGKTGTTQENVDAWFIGYTPYYVSGVWIGNDSPAIKLNQGSSMASDLWRNIMTKAHEGLENKNFKKPEGVVTASVCTQSGKKPTGLCSRDPRGGTVISEIFAQGTVPSGSCDVHVELKVDSSTNKIASEFCPSNLVASRVFIKRDPPYNPANHGGIIPKDYEFTAPTGICSVHNSGTKPIDKDDKHKDKDKDKDKDDEDDEDDKDENEDKPLNEDINTPPEGEDDENNGRTQPGTGGDGEGSNGNGSDKPGDGENDDDKPGEGETDGKKDE